MNIYEYNIYAYRIYFFKFLHWNLVTSTYKTHHSRVTWLFNSCRIYCPFEDNALYLSIHLTHTCMLIIIYIGLTLYCSLDYDESFWIKHKSILHVYKSCLLSLCLFYRVVTTRGSSSPISRTTRSLAY